MLDKQFHFLSPVEVVRVTKDNLEEVAQWCGGQVAQTESKHRKGQMDSYVWVPTPKSSDNSIAYPNMYITKRVVIGVKGELKVTWGVYRRNYFERNYFDSPKDAVDKTWEPYYKQLDKEKPVKDPIEGRARIPEQRKPAVSPADLMRGEPVEIKTDPQLSREDVSDSVKNLTKAMTQTDLNAGLPQELPEGGLPEMKEETVPEGYSVDEAKQILDAGVMDQATKEIIKNGLDGGSISPDEALSTAGIETVPDKPAEIKPENQEPETTPVPTTSAIEEAPTEDPIPNPETPLGPVEEPAFEAYQRSKDELYAYLDKNVPDAALRLEIKTSVAKGDLSIDEAFAMVGQR